MELSQRPLLFSTAHEPSNGLSIVARLITSLVKRAGSASIRTSHPSRYTLRINGLCVQSVKAGSISGYKMGTCTFGVMVHTLECRHLSHEVRVGFPERTKLSPI